MSDEDERKNIERCTALLEKASGQKIVGWLSPRGTSKPTTPKLLADAGYRWYGDVFDTDLPYVANHGNKKIVAIPLSYDVNDMPSMKYGHPPRMMLESFNEVIGIARARDDELRIIDVTSHAHIFGHHRGAHFYEKIIEQAMTSPDIWVGTRAEIADHVLSMTRPPEDTRQDLPGEASSDSVRHGGADVAQGGDVAARSGGADDPRRRGRHRADADDEGRRVPADAGWSACTRSSPSIRASPSAGNALRIGAMATLSDVEHDANVAARLPVLKRAMRTLSNVRVRNVARVGGALAHGDPHMDLPPVLAALGARVSISGPNGNRELPVEAALCRLLRDRSGQERADHRRDRAGAGRPQGRLHESHVAHRRRLAGARRCGLVRAQGRRDPRSRSSSSAPRPRRSRAWRSAEKALQGAAPDDAALARAGDAAAAEAQILADAHGSAAYKRELLRVYLRRAVRQALAEGAQ